MRILKQERLSLMSIESQFCLLIALNNGLLDGMTKNDLSDLVGRLDAFIRSEKLTLQVTRRDGQHQMVIFSQVTEAPDQDEFAPGSS